MSLARDRDRLRPEEWARRMDAVIGELRARARKRRERRPMGVR